MATISGKVCPKHPELKGERASNGRCRGCIRDANRKWRAANLAKAHECERKYRAANQEKVRKWRAAYCEKAKVRARERYAVNPEKVLAYGRKWRAENSEKAREIARSWAAANPIARQAMRARRRARKANAYVSLTASERARELALREEARRLTRETGEAWHVDHDLSLALGGKHHPDNMMVIPAAINLAKGARYKSTMEFLLS